MGRKHTHDELNKCSHGELVTMVIAMLNQMDALNANIEKLIEQVRVANSYRFGRHTEKPEVIDGAHQDEFLRGDRPKDLLRSRIVTSSLLFSILNVKYVNSAPLYRIEQEFSRGGVNISRQTMANWIFRSAHKYFAPFWERMKQELLKLHVTQKDKTPTQVLNDDRSPGGLSYMWVHRSGEFYKQCPLSSTNTKKSATTDCLLRSTGITKESL